MSQQLFILKRLFWSLAGVLFFLNLNAEAQNYAKIDSLHAALLQISSDIEKADVYNQLAWEYHEISQYDSLLNCAERALMVSKKSGYDRGKIAALNYIGLYHYITSNYIQAIEHCENALLLSKEIGYLRGIADAYNYMGLTYIDRGNYVKAIEYQQNFLETSQKIGDKKGIADAHSNIGLAYLKQEMYEKAMFYYTQALELHKEINHKSGIGYTLHSIGTIYQRKGNFEEALRYFHQTMKVREEIEDKRGIIYLFITTSEIYQEQGNYQQAIDYALDGLKKSDALDYKWGKIASLIAIGHNYQYLHQYAQAIEYLSDALHIAREIRALDHAERTSKLLHECYFQVGKYEKAYNYQALYNQYKDSLNQEEQIRMLSQMESSYEIARKEAENKLLAQENFVKDLQIKRQNTIFLSILAIVALLIGFVYALYRGNVRRKHVNLQLSQKNQEINLQKEEIMAQSEQILQQNRELAKANEVLAELNQEKDNLIGVVAHDLRAPLNKVKGFTELIPLSGSVNEEQDYYLKMIDEVVDSGNRLIAELLEVSNLDNFNTQFHIAPLELHSFVEELIHNYGLPALKKQIRINLEHNDEEMMIHTDRDALRRILDNLLSNALKFSPKNNQVQVRLYHHEKVTQISVKDGGPGINDDDRKKLFKKFQKLAARPTGGESSTGLGLYIVKVLTDRLGGTVSVTSEPGKGAEFIVKLPTCRNETIVI